MSTDFEPSSYDHAAYLRDLDHWNRENRYAAERLEADLNRSRRFEEEQIARNDVFFGPGVPAPWARPFTVVAIAIMVGVWAYLLSQ